MTQRGQVAAFIALLSLILVGFVGLVIDGGEVAATQQQASAAADGAALAAGYGVTLSGATIASATTLAGDVMTENGLPTSELTLSFYDSGGAVTGNAGSVASVSARVAHPMRTFFMSVLGVHTVTVSAAATASVPASGSSCALCVMAGSGTTLGALPSSVVQVTGGRLTINSTGNPALALGNNASVTAPSVVIVGGHYFLGPGASVSPAPITGTAATDPLAARAAPVVSGAPVAYSSPNAGSGSVSPGVYSSITVNGAYALTLNPGTYVVTGSIDVAGGSLTGSGVTIYLACPGYPTTCGSGGGGGGGGGSLNISGGTATITAPSSGTYSGIAVWADPNDNGSSTVSAGALTVNGMFDAVLMPFLTTSSNLSVTFNGVTLLYSIGLATRTTFTVAASRGAGVALK